MRNRLAIRYAVQGDLRFISHHDSLRLFKRAVARAAVPVRYSEGFNPRPKLRIALPRPVGVASLDELLVLELTTEEDPADLLTRLSAHVPDGMRLLSADALATGDRRLPVEVQYALELEPEVQQQTARSVAAFLGRPHVLVERASARMFDIRPFIRTLSVTDGTLRWTQAVTPEGTPRVGEVLESLGLSNQDHLHRVVRQTASYRP
ncbi:MAG: TIGR03936 family radical SAM-associated protein [Phycisphaerae bacterium]